MGLIPIAPHTELHTIKKIEQFLDTACQVGISIEVDRSFIWCFLQCLGFVAFLEWCLINDNRIEAVAVRLTIRNNGYSGIIVAVCRAERTASATKVALLRDTAHLDPCGSVHFMFLV
jgi:hypothetical protein